MPLDRTDRTRQRTRLIGNIAEIAVGDSGVGIPVADNIESVEGIKAEAHRLLANDMKIFEH